eukprot:957199_1
MTSDTSIATTLSYYLTLNPHSFHTISMRKYAEEIVRWIEFEPSYRGLPLHLTISAITGQEVKHNDTWVTKPVSISKEMTIDIHPEVKENDEHLQNQNTERTWAYLKLQQLAENMFINQDICDATVSPLSLALKYKFVTPWTSMIVVKKKH